MNDAVPPALTAADVIGRMHPAVAGWFTDQFAAPTPVQLRGWDAISRGEHVLLGAPTGSGKTLAAFLYSLAQLAGAGAGAGAGDAADGAGETRAAGVAPREREERLRVVYVSPLRALNYDIERNLVAPLTGIARTAAKLGMVVPDIVTAVRTGDTSLADRRRFLKHSADVLITTPESLYVMLTTSARELFTNVDTIIVDEIHALASSKRGTHMAITLERLEEAVGRPVQRIGLSATQRPIERVAAFLGGVGRDVTIIESRDEKRYDVEVRVAVEDMTAVGAPIPASLDELDEPTSNADAYSIWGALHGELLDEIEQHRSTIVFTNSRRLSERLAGALNDLHVKRELTRARDRARAEGRDPGEVDEELHVAPIARAHHGSISREARREMEEQLKAGELPVIVATSSLELGIDMGAVDAVLQVESPRSVASGIQRIGRAGHDVGAVSRARIYPKHRHDLVECAAVTRSVLEGKIEPVHIPELCLDVLAQQLIAIGVDEDVAFDDAFTLVRRADPYRDLSREQFDNLVALLAGRFPVDDLADLRPRIVVDDGAGTYRTRSDAARTAVINAGTIPDRGLYGVFIAGGGPGRVGELDEEMVHETRLGDVIVLGASSWRVEEITYDRVLVTPVPGAIGKVPFWHGESNGRTVSLGRDVGELVRHVGTVRSPVDRDGLPAELDADGRDHDLVVELERDWHLNTNAAHNLIRYVREQAAATGALPTDRCVVVERFRDELGDWRICILTPWGKAVHAPWAMAIEARLSEQHGMDVAALWSDDGIALRVPDTETPIALELLLPDRAEVEDLVIGELARSALFASRFREIATRSLLLPLAHFRKRSPLWLQRLKAHDVLQSAQQHGSFPMVLETYRECMRDVFDMPAFEGLLAQIADRSVEVVDVETRSASPFSASLLFDYTANLLYDNDRPAAERRAQALSLDQALLRELLGTDELRELLDEDAICTVEDELQRRAEGRRARSVDAVHDVVRALGDLTRDELRARIADDVAGVDAGPDAAIDALLADRRLVEVRIAGEARIIAIEDTGTYLAALGTRLPPGIPQVMVDMAAGGVAIDPPLMRLIARFVRTHAPCAAPVIAERFGLAEHEVVAVLDELVAADRVIRGGFLPGGEAGSVEYCDPEVLRRVRRRTLAMLRREVEPIEQQQLARFLLEWQGVTRPVPGSVHALREVIMQLEGVEATPATWELDLLPSRIADFQRGWLDELIGSGHVQFVGTSTLGGDVAGMLLMAEHVPLLAPMPAVLGEDPAVLAVHEVLTEGGALFTRDIAERAGLDEVTVAAALWRLCELGRCTNDAWGVLRTGAATRTRAAGGRPSVATAPVTRRTSARASRRGGRSGRTRIGAGRAAGAAAEQRSGRWSLVSTHRATQGERAAAHADALLDCYGVAFRGAAQARSVPGGFASIYAELSNLETLGTVRRGYFVEGLGGAQFADPDAVERMRAMRTQDAATSVGDTPAAGAGSSELVALRASDPANPFGTILPWSEIDGARAPQRATNAYVVLDGGMLLAHVSPAGRRMSLFVPERAADVFALLARLVAAGRLDRLAVDHVNGAAITAELIAAAHGTGFVQTPRGIRVTSATARPAAASSASPARRAGSRGGGAGSVAHPTHGAAPGRGTRGSGRDRGQGRGRA